MKIKILQLSSCYWYIVFLFFFLVLLFFHTHGFISYDDGWFLQDGLRILNGEKVYKDFEFLYNPGSLYIHVLAFSLFGKSIFASRILALVNSCTTVLLLFWISKHLKFGWIISFGLLGMYVFWGPGHINFVWPVMFCVTAAIGSGALLLKSSKNSSRTFMIFLIGVLAAYTLIFKQNFGLAIFITNILFFITIKRYRNLKIITLYFTGYFVIILLQLLYFVCTDSLAAYFQQFYLYTFVKIYQHGILNSSLPWDYHQSLPITAFKILLYLSPLIISLWSFIVVVRREKNKTLIYFPLINSAFYLLSIRPTTDYIHLAPLLSLSAIPLALIFKNNSLLKTKVLVSCILLAFVLGGVYSSLFRNYYRWNTPLIYQNMFIDHPRVLIWTDEKEKNTVTAVTNYYNQNAQKERYTFIYSFTPMYYFILDKKNPTRYEDLQLGGLSLEEQNEVIYTLQRKKVNHLITDSPIIKGKTLIEQFIQKHYIPVSQTNEYTIWKLILTPKTT